MISAPKKNPLSSPLYQIPLTDEELITVARICVMWGNLDVEIDHIISTVLKLSAAEFAEQFGDKMIGSKVSKLRQRAATIEDPAKKLVIEMCDALTACLTDRNVMVHGTWGFEYDEEQGVYHRLAYSFRRREHFYARDLVGLHERVSAATLSVDACWYRLVQQAEPPPALNRRQLFGDGPPKVGPPPDFSR